MGLGTWFKPKDASPILEYTRAHQGLVGLEHLPSHARSFPVVFYWFAKHKDLVGVILSSFLLHGGVQGLAYDGECLGEDQAGRDLDKLAWFQTRSATR